MLNSLDNKGIRLYPQDIPAFDSFADAQTSGLVVTSSFVLTVNNIEGVVSDAIVNSDPNGIAELQSGHKIPLAIMEDGTQMWRFVPANEAGSK